MKTEAAEAQRQVTREIATVREDRKRARNRLQAFAEPLAESAKRLRPVFERLAQDKA